MLSNADDTRSDRVTQNDNHHIFFQARFWRTGYLKELRDHFYCKAIIPRETLHRDIHIFVGSIPAPKGLNAKNALCQLRLLQKYNAISKNDSLEKKLCVLIALFDIAEPETTTALRHQLQIVREFYDKPP